MIRTFVLGTLIALLAVACSSPATQQTVDVSQDEDAPAVEEQIVKLGNFEQTPDMKASRERFAAIRLTDGRVLAVGGRGRGLGNVEVGNFEESAELFDSETETWSLQVKWPPNASPRQWSN